ncbi:TetR family transcriptional regulator [Streptomyces chumphonensis]|uniref:TetR family transcriptional regulator n=1 Tax=Streptomyces chumphonensis TaxID=1214925 RepID=UPI003D708C94
MHGPPASRPPRRRHPDDPHCETDAPHTMTPPTPRPHPRTPRGEAPRAATYPRARLTPPDGPPLTERQEERRRRILRATTQLARRGGFDAVQMREVAESAQVALGTLYRYFPSKVHLLVATMQDQLEQLLAALHKQPPTQSDPAERVAETLMRAFRAMQREPHLADAMVRALTFADRSASSEVDTVLRLTTAIILDAMGPAEEPTPRQLSAVRVIEHTWLLSLITWLAGRASLDQVRADITTVSRLVEQPPPPGE